MSRKRSVGPVVEAVPEGDNRSRMVCPDCGYIEYDNPKIIVGAVCVWRGEVLLCRRAIQPRIGFWTIPAGFMELNETTGQGATREVWEEARARVEVTGLVGIYEIPHISQVYVIHGARMTEAGYSVGEESQEVALFGWDAIPWDELAFPSVSWALERYRRGMAPAVHVAMPRT